MCVYCAVYIYYVYIITHTCMYISEQNVVYVLNIFIYNIKYEYKYRHVNIFKIHTVCVCIYIYINIHRTTHIMQTKTFILYAINHN